jgi:hypothetical protein
MKIAWPSNGYRSSEVDAFLHNTLFSIPSGLDYVVLPREQKALVQHFVGELNFNR